jgi:hypothetical protein
VSDYGVGVLPRRRSGRFVAGARARLRRSSLDAALAAGSSPWSSPELLLRAQRLTSAPERQRAAIALEALVECACRPAEAAHLRLRAPAILANRETLMLLAAHLRGSAPAPASVIARLQWLTRDESSPAYVGGRRPETLRQVAEGCLAAVD